MCGIYFSLNIDDEIQTDLLDKRGPDSVRLLKSNLLGKSVRMYSTVLHMRGNSVTPQPLKSDNFVLQWNGEIFDGHFSELQSESDTNILWQCLERNGNDVVKTISAVRGPFAFVCLDCKNGVVWFGRDIFGRRSLLIKQTKDSLLLQSVGGGGDEVQALGIYEYNILTAETALHSWSSLGICIPRITKNFASVAKDILDSFINLLKQSITRRLVNVRESITILFSGGVDCLLLAALTAQLAKELEIILVNVAFSGDDADDRSFEDVPDRITGRRAFDELKFLFPDTKFKFLAQNVSKQQFDAKLSHIRQLAAPNGGVMDESIAAALWFASDRPSSRVLFVGMGADEQFGGYSRHLNKFRRQGFEGLADELQLDLDRISCRNLGRDDRIISDHGVEARLPFLDEEFVSFSAQIPLHLKMDIDSSHDNSNVQNKIILRQALKSIGFSDDICTTAKRAIQFGARSARLQRIS